ncbi:MAG: dTDP-4-dehydrorhamnose reductase [Hyphomicrobiaceae bacterium]
MRLLIAGAQGQLARAMIELAPSAEDVTAFALGRPALDLTAPATVLGTLADFKPDVIVNAAAYTAVDQAEVEPGAAIALNAEGPKRLAEAAARMGAVLIHISTDQVFDGTKPGPYVEGDATAPLSAYGRSKLAGEEAVRATAPRHIILRTSWVYSPFGTNFVINMLRLARQRAEVRVVNDQTGNPTYAPHLAEAILGIARAVTAGPPSSVWGTYHAAGAGAVTWCGFAQEIMRVSAACGGASAAVVPITTAEYPTRAKRPANSRLDCSKLAEMFGIHLPSWQEGVAACVARLEGSSSSAEV